MFGKMMKRIFKRTRFSISLFVLSVFLILTSCEEKIEISLEEGSPQLAVDAWITDARQEQKIVLTKTSGYFNNGAPPAALGAEVKLIDDVGNSYFFKDSLNQGVYIWKPGPLDTIARIGHEYRLFITYNGQNYTSVTTMQPSVTLDSLTFKKEVTGLSSDSVIRAEFWARDNFGRMDYYWIRNYRNGVFNNQPGAILTAQQAAFGNGDGFIFIVPYRQGINDFGKPFLSGDMVKVEIYGINESSYNFLNQARSQMTNGGLFATPPYNVISNIKNTNALAETSDNAVGWFEVCSANWIEKQAK